jgi:N-acetylglucosamine kinase
MKCFLGIDGGGTKTECVLLNETGAIIARGKGAASNPTRIGFTAALEGLKQSCDSAIGSTRIALDVLAVCAGLAGTGRPENRAQMQQFLAQRFAGALVDVRTDIELALAAMPDGAAIVLVVGTGSAAIGRDTAGSVKREGGLGPATSDEGSAFDIGSSAVALARAGNSSAESDQLSREILEHLGLSDWAQVDLQSAVHADSVYPRLFPVVARLAEAGNSLAQSVLTGAAEKLAVISHRLADALNVIQQPIHLGKTGGTMGRSRFFDRAIDRELRAKLPNAMLTPLYVAPAEVAAWIALQLFTNSAGAAP